jgi:MFS family permease
LTGAQKKTFAACFAGWALDGFDFQLFPLIIPSLVALWHIDNATAGLLGTVTLLMSAVGGWIAGQLADRIGRVRTLQLTVAWFSVFTCLCGLCTNVEQLFVARSLMGLGFGGEWTAGSVLIAEVVSAKWRGRAVGLVQSSWAIGWGAAVLAGTVILTDLPPEWSWRVLFGIGLLPALLLLYIRSNVKEPEIFREKKQEKGAPLIAIFAPAHLRTTIPAALLLTGMQGAYHAITTWLPTFLRTTKGLSVMSSRDYLMVVIVGSFLGYVSGAFLTDKLGRKWHIALYGLCGFATVFAYTHLDIGNDAMLWLGFPLGFFASGIFSGVGAYLSELYPTAVRGTGQGFCYNFGRGIGALIPWIVGSLSARLGLGEAVGIFAAGSYLLVFVSVAFLPETRGRELID